MPFVGLASSPLLEINIALLVANFSHFFSVLILYRLSELIFPQSQSAGRSRAFLAASLHIISPAGLFLVAPFAESSFSFLSFSGFYLYAEGRKRYRSGRVITGDLMTLVSGAVFGLATTVRSNGLLCGLLFLYDAAIVFRALAERPTVFGLQRLTAVVFGGLCIGFGAFLPQYIAYNEYCSSMTPESSSRPWCKKLVPSVYSWVQVHYWQVLTTQIIVPKLIPSFSRKVGFLRYWTISNLPLFLLAAPMLYILGQSALWGWFDGPEIGAMSPTKSERSGRTSGLTVPDGHVNLAGDIVARFAMPQFVLAILALTSYHVQTITRQSSAYPVWYWWLASMLVEPGETLLLRRKQNISRLVVRWMVLYAMIQGGLFSSFLPPA